MNVSISAVAAVLGEMLAHLEAVGVPVGRRVATLRDRVARFGLTLGDQGDPM